MTQHTTDQAVLAHIKQLVAEESKWKKMTGAIARIMWPAEES